MAEKKMIKLLCGAEAEDVQGEELEEIKRLQVYGANGVIRPIPGKPHIPKIYLSQEHYIYNFNFRPTDVFVGGSMKSGTTWLHEILWTMHHNLDLSNPISSHSPIMRLPFFEACSFVDLKDPKAVHFTKSISEMYKLPPCENIMEAFDALPPVRVFKTHFVPYLLSPKMLETCKVIYIMRHPMDSFQSYYHFVKNMEHHKFSGTLEEFASTYIKSELYTGNAVYSMKNWWPYRNHKNVYFIHYEDLKDSPHEYVKKIGEFVGKDLSAQEINNIVKQTSFKTMKASPAKEAALDESKMFSAKKARSLFFREGKSGTAKDSLPKHVYDQLATFFTEELKELDIPYKF